MKAARVLLVLALLLTLTAWAEAGKGKGKGKGNGAKNLDGTHGVVTGVDDAAKTFTIRTGKKNDANAQEITVHYNAGTKFAKLGDSGLAEATSEDLAAKARVVVAYDTKDGENVATKVTFVQRRKKK